MTVHPVIVVIQEEIPDKELIMRQTITILILIISFIRLNGQAGTESVSGTVSFISSQNIYVKFKSTEGISEGDTLYKLSKGKTIPVLRVNNLSSGSCACSSIPGVNLLVADIILATRKNAGVKPDGKIIGKVADETEVKIDTTVSSITKSLPASPKQRINGSISAYSYSNFLTTSAVNSTRFRYTFSLDAQNIANTKFSIESYISFNHKTDGWNEVKADLFSALKIYSLALRYDLNKTTRISLGRKINPRISSIGAMDGFQVEKSFNKFALGALIGSSPNYANYSFDSKLFQYGAYLSYSSVTPINYIETSLAFMQQMNNSKTDRRFLYFQHSNSLIKNIYFFSTFEVDLYKLNEGLPQNVFDPTSLYLSLRYKITRNFTLSSSYDARKNVMLYETYKTFIDQMLENALRQNIMVRADYRITKDLTIGLQSGYRFLKSDPHPSKNLNGYITYYNLPGINVSVTLTGTYLESSYLNGKIFGTNVSRNFFQGKFQTSIGYSYVDYTYPESIRNEIQNIGEMNISWFIFKKTSLSANYEGTFEKLNKYARLFLQIRQRF